MFVNLLRTSDHVQREMIWWALRRKGVMDKEILAITEMYKYTTTFVRINDEQSKK